MSHEFQEVIEKSVGDEDYEAWVALDMAIRILKPAFCVDVEGGDADKLIKSLFMAAREIEKHVRGTDNAGDVHSVLITAFYWVVLEASSCQSGVCNFHPRSSYAHAFLIFSKFMKTAELIADLDSDLETLGDCYDFSSNINAIVHYPGHFAVKAVDCLIEGDEDAKQK